MSLQRLFRHGISFRRLVTTTSAVAPFRTLVVPSLVRHRFLHSAASLNAPKKIATKPRAKKTVKKVTGATKGAKAKSKKRSVKAKPKKVAAKKKAKKPAKPKVPKRLVRPPKRPASTGWSIYVKEKLSGHKGPINDEIKTLAGEWRSLSDAQKDPYNNRAASQFAKWKTDYERFLVSLTPEQRQAENQYRLYKNKKAKTSKTKHYRLKLIRNPALPKPPKSAYLLFANENYKSAAPGTSIVEAAKLAGARWRTMSASDKAMFVNQAANESAAYRKAKGV